MSPYEAGAGYSRRGRFRRRSRPPSRAGRNLPAAIAVSVLLGGAIIASLYTIKAAFVGLVAAATVVAITELVRSLRHGGMRVAIVPLAVGGAAMLVGAYIYGPPALVILFVLTVLAVLVWRMPTGSEGYVRDTSAGVLVAVYVPLLASFAVLLAAPVDGANRVLILVLLTTLIDTGAYATGVFFGRHLMAPLVSPGKTWEGFAGSALASIGGGAVLVFWLLGGELWQGAVLGGAVLVSATCGDLAESLVKRDLGIKDMGTLLPGHGGLMDRLDSMLPSAPVAWALLAAFVPPA